MLKVILVEDHPAVREGIQASFDRLGPDHGVKLVAAAANAESGKTACRKYKPNVILVDHRLGGGQTGVDLARDMRECGAAFVLYSSDIRPSLLQDGTDAGITCFVLKDAYPEEIIRACKFAANGRAYLDPSLQRDRSAVKLTPAEARVMTDLASGMKLVEIATRRVNSPDTIRTHANNARRKLGASTNTHAVVLALQAGLIALD